MSQGDRIRTQAGLRRITLTGPSALAGETEFSDAIKKLRSESSWSVRLNRMLQPRSEPPRGLFGFAMFPWVLTDGTAGHNTIAVTDRPLKLGPTTKQYYSATIEGVPVNYALDAALVTNNEERYVNEAIYALIALGYTKCYLTIDTTDFIYGDSFAAAIVAAALSPSQDLLITGGISLDPNNNILLTPVGKIGAKVAYAVDSGIPIIAPYENDTVILRESVEGTAAVTMGDIVLGLLTQTPTLVLVANATELMLALSFMKATKSDPVGQTEQVEYQRIVTESQQKSSQILTERDQYKAEGKTPTQLEQIKNMSFDISLPNGTTMPFRLFDPLTWDQYEDVVYAPNDRDSKGLGLTRAKMLNFIQQGAVDRLRGIAQAVMSKTRSGRQPRRSKQGKSRIAPYKQPPATQIASIIARLRPGPQPPQPVTPPQAQGDVSGMEE